MITQDSSKKDIVVEVVSLLRAYNQEPDNYGDFAKEVEREGDPDNIGQEIVNTTTSRITETIVSQMTEWGIMPKEEIEKIFRQER